MTLDGLRGFFRTQIDALGYREWEDGFNRNNIPATVIDRAYHLQIGRIVSAPANQLHHVFSFPIKVSVHRKGFRNPSVAIDQTLADAQNIMSVILAPETRLQTNGLKDIRPTSVEVVPLSESNDNAVIVEIEFSSVLIFKF